MPPIAVAVRDVVDQIDDARKQTEDGERRRRAADRGRIEQPAAEEQAGEDQQVLGPLAWTQGDEQCERERTDGRLV